MIEVTIGKVEEKKKVEFPKLMRAIDTGAIVLFRSLREGTVIVKGKDSTMDAGDYSKAWDMGYFEDFNESITIQNKVD